MISFSVVEFFRVLKLVEFIVFLQRTGHKVVCVHELENKESFLHRLDKFVFIFIFMQLRFENNLVLSGIEFILHASDSSKEFEWVDKVFLDFQNLIVYAFIKELCFKVIQKIIHDQDVYLTNVFVIVNIYLKTQSVRLCTISKS